jgi:Domain of unknown function (DUF4126)
MSVAEYLLAAALGVSLAAAVGLRVFVPVLAMAVAAKVGMFDLTASFAWLSSNTTIAMLAVAAAAEIAAYYLPGVDHVLDALAAPLAIAAGTLVVAVPMGDLSPLLKWTTAVIAGGGVAGMTHGLTAMLRAKSAVTTAGLANPVVATGELGGSVLLSLLALVVPLAAVVLLLLGLVLLIRLLLRRRRHRTA